MIPSDCLMALRAKLISAVRERLPKAIASLEKRNREAKGLTPEQAKMHNELTKLQRQNRERWEAKKDKKMNSLKKRGARESRLELGVKVTYSPDGSMVTETRSCPPPTLQQKKADSSSPGSETQSGHCRRA